MVGHLYTSEYEDKDGVRRSSVEVRATSVGPDLARCTAKVAPLPKPAPTPAPEPEGEGEGEGGVDDPETGDDIAGEAAALPLSA